MYAKLFSSILDSSVWLEAPPTRLVWLTLLAAKDQDGFARFATVENLAARARISIEDAQKAVTILEAPDENSSNPDHEGRRIERVPGGWIVLNAALYDAIAKREQERAEVRERVRKHRAGKAAVTGNTTAVTPPPESMPKPRATKPDTTWLTPICDVYERHFGAGSFPYGQAAKTFKSLRDAGFSSEEIASRFDRYASRLDDIKYLSLAKFRQTFGAYAGGAVQKSAGRGGVAQQTYDAGRAALGLGDD